MRIFLDANILFSAAKSDGAIRRLLKGSQERGHQCWVDGFVIEEARRNLAAKVPDYLEAFDTLLLGLNIAPVQSISGRLHLDCPLADKDRPVLAAAIKLRCEVLLTGDQIHFGPLFGESFAGVTILPPRALAERVLQG